MRPLQFHLAARWKLSENKRSELVPIPKEIKDQLEWWTNTKALIVGVPLSTFKPDMSIFTDASTEGWGAHLENQEISGTWNKQEKTLHINILELRAVRQAMDHFSVQLAEKQLLVATDNTTVIAYINHQGGTRLRSLMEETNQLFLLAQEMKISVKAQHIPGRLNVLADKLSRKHQTLPTEWSIHPAVLESLWQRWDKPMIDLFARKENNKLSL